jgi:hypothetical protein
VGERVLWGGHIAYGPKANCIGNAYKQEQAKNAPKGVKYFKGPMVVRNGRLRASCGDAKNPTDKVMFVNDRLELDE